MLGKDGVERDEERRVLTMMYEGRLPDGSVFDSTDRKKGAVRHRWPPILQRYVCAGLSIESFFSSFSSCSVFRARC